MDTQDSDEKNTRTTVPSSKLAWLKQRLSELKKPEVEINEHPDKQISQTDPDSRLMQTRNVIRKQTVEYPFGTIKMWMGANHFLTKGFKNVGTEMNLHVLAYNMRRMMTILGAKGLMAAIRQ
jgi:hypothetical protein